MRQLVLPVLVVLALFALLSPGCAALTAVEADAVVQKQQAFIDDLQSQMDAANSTYEELAAELRTQLEQATNPAERDRLQDSLAAAQAINAKTLEILEQGEAFAQGWLDRFEASRNPDGSIGGPSQVGAFVEQAIGTFAPEPFRTPALLVLGLLGAARARSNRQAARSIPASIEAMREENPEFNALFDKLKKKIAHKQTPAAKRIVAEATNSATPLPF